MLRLKFASLTFALLSLFVLLPNFNLEARHSSNPTKDLVDTAADAENFSILLAAVQTAGLEEALRGDSDLTVLAPTDDAFTALLDELGISAEDLLASPNLADILLYHVLPGSVSASDIAKLDSAETLQGDDVEIQVERKAVKERFFFWWVYRFVTDIKVNDANVVAKNIRATNGIIHVIDKVLMPPKDLVDTAVEADDFTILQAALEKADLVGALKGEGPFTVLAPTDAAFGALLEELGVSAEELLANPNLKDILLYHVLPGEARSEDVAKLETATTLEGSDVEIRARRTRNSRRGWVTEIQINDSLVVAKDIVASNGVIHVIDKVLMPPMDLVDTAVDAGDFNILAQALEKADLIGALKGDGPFTVLAPTDAAFEALLEELEISASDLLESPNLTNILLYHVIPGAVRSSDVVKLKTATTLEGSDVEISVKYRGWRRSRGAKEIRINDALIVSKDITASNGVIHVIDKVLMPPKDLVDTAVDAGNFTILAKALEAADLVGALKGEGPFTVLAPTDAAFGKLLEELDITEEELLASPNLSSILLYHVIPGRVRSSEVVKLDSAETLEGSEVDIQVKYRRWFWGRVSSIKEIRIDDAKVIAKDILASNGIIHVIDSVLMP